MIFYGYGYGEDIIYFMLHQRRMAIEENKTAVQIDQYEYLKKGNDLQNDDDNNGIVEYGNDYTNCKIIHDKNSS